jgi:hypothetical protein
MADGHTYAEAVTNAEQIIDEWSDWGERHGRLSRDGSGRAVREQPRYNGSKPRVNSGGPFLSRAANSPTPEICCSLNNQLSTINCFNGAETYVGAGVLS